MSDAGNEIVVLRLDGARERVLPVPKGVVPAGGPAWHPDGRELAFAAYRRGGRREGGGPYDIYSGALGGGELRKWEVCGGAAVGRSPAWLARQPVTRWRTPWRMGPAPGCTWSMSVRTT
jgi:Tol biopolymer transport system component